jgi:acetylornithine deacetylase/succinyl-diaminopimelate desuccinylase-like protein
MAPVIELLRGEIAATLAESRDPLLGPCTLSIGTISGGSKTNIVPDECRLTVDIRTIPLQDVPELIDAIRGRVEHVSPGIEMKVVRSNPLRTDPAHPLIRHFEALGARCVGAPWFCDAAIFAAAGVPSIAMGPGSIAQAHTKDEWIQVADLEAGVERFRAFLRRL